MATREMSDGRTGVTRSSTRSLGSTKPNLRYKSTEFYAFLASVAAVLIAAAQADNFDAPRAWTLVAALAVGYMVSRGLAKSGSAHRDRD